MPRPDPDDRRPDNPKKSNLLDTLTLVFLVMSGVGLFLSLQGPANNPAQLMFRLGIIGVSLAGLLTVQVIKWTQPREP